MTRSIRGKRNYHDGLVAEGSVERAYAAARATVAARRWRGASGEIDLILRKGAQIIFVEVKKASDFARAAERLSERQLARIARTAEEFLAREPGGGFLDARIDLALVNARGETHILENVTV